MLALSLLEIYARPARLESSRILLAQECVQNVKQERTSIPLDQGIAHLVLSSVPRLRGVMILQAVPAWRGTPDPVQTAEIVQRVLSGRTSTQLGPARAQHARLTAGLCLHPAPPQKPVNVMQGMFPRPCSTYQRRHRSVSVLRVRWALTSLSAVMGAARRVRCGLGGHQRAAPRGKTVRATLAWSEVIITGEIGLSGTGGTDQARVKAPVGFVAEESTNPGRIFRCVSIAPRTA